MKYLKIFIVLAVVILLFSFFFKNVDFASVARIIKNLNPLYPIVFIFGTVFQFFVRAYRWGIILEPYKQKIPIMSLYNYTVIGFFFNVIPGGRIGEAARGFLLAQREKISKSAALATVVLERIMDIFTMILLLLLSIHLLNYEPTQFLLQMRRISMILLIIVVLIMVLFYLINLML